MSTRAGRWAPPISVQVMGLLVGGLVAAQAATFALSTLLPAPAPPQYRLTDIAAALRGGPLQGEGVAPLARAARARAPDPHSPGWQVSPKTGEDLAGLMHVDPADVEVLVYSPPPFAGAGGRRTASLGGDLAGALSAMVASPALAAPAGGEMGGGPGGLGPGGMSGPGGVGGPGGMGGRGGGPWHGGGPGGGRGQGSMSRSGPDGAGGPAGGWGRGVDAPVAPVPRGAPDGPMASSGGGPDAGGGPIARGAQPGGPGQGRRGGDGPIRTAPLEVEPFSPGPPVMVAPPPTLTSQAAAPPQIIDPPIHLPRAEPVAAAETRTAQTPTHPAASSPLSTSRPAPSPRAMASTPRGETAPAPVELLPPPVAHTLFGLASAPVVDGEFLAAYREGPGRWITVRPIQDAVLSRWQRRIGLWFLAAFAAVAPLGWWMSRRLAAPLAALADTADRLGRDPSTPVPRASGSPEISRLAAALTGMQARLQRHVEDRTAMVGAISHDLRTPLARMRFKLERAPPALQASLLRDLSHMQEMLDAVLLFIRDASGPSPREIADLRSIVECVVDDAALVGGEASLEPGGAAAVEVDITAVQRVVTNLVENALKYGGAAQVRLYPDGLEAVVQVRDRGPGLPPDELEQVFQPFYRSEEGRRVSATGIGLGLSVSRSIARAHGGEVSLRNVEGGLQAELRLPLALARSAETSEREAFAPAA